MHDKIKMYTNDSVEHDATCHDTNCITTKPHRKVYFFETQGIIYCAHSLHEAAMFWKDSGCWPLVNVGSLG